MVYCEHLAGPLRAWQEHMSEYAVDFFTECPWQSLVMRGAGGIHMHYKNVWILLIMLLAGIVLGGFMGQLAEGISWLEWLNFGQSFGLDSPLVINFGILVITFGLTIKITMASIIGVALALIIYRYI